MNAPVHLQLVTWPDLARRAHPPVLLIPVGSTEQHGPHLPLGTDTLIAEGLAESAATAALADLPGGTAEPPYLIGPSLTVSASGEHAGFPGTLSIGTAATATSLIELGRSAEWARAVVFVNGHGGNYEAVTTAMTALRSEGRRVRAWWPQISGGDLHAGATETALMLALHPALVHRDRAVAGPQPSMDALRAHGVHTLSPTGVLGDPTGATAIDGERLIGLLITHLRQSLSDWSSDWPTDWPEKRPEERSTALFDGQR